MSTARAGFAAVFTMAFLAGCWGTEGRQAAVEEAVRDDMWQHWDEGTALRDAVVAGDLALVHAKAKAFDKRLPVSGLPEAARPHEVELKRILGELSEAGDLTQASASVGTLALTCGRCHGVVGAVPGHEADMPPATAGIKAEMVRHQWAIERMWLGLVRGDAELFATSVDALAEAPLVPSGTPADSPLPPLATELELAVHELAQSAKAASDDEARARRFGELLVTCATCHALIRDHRKP